MLNKASSSLSANLPSSSIIREIQCVADDDHASVLSPGSGNDDGDESSRWRLREMASLKKLISTERTFMQELPETLSRQRSKMSEAFAEFEEVEDKCGVMELRRMKKFVLQSRKLFDSSILDIPNPNLFFLDNVVHDMPPVFQKSAFFRDFEIRYREMGTELKNCLLCLAVFPENVEVKRGVEVQRGVEVKRRVLVQWWIGEGFIPPQDRGNGDPKPAEWYGDRYFDELIRKGFLEPVTKKHSPRVNTCRMHPLVREVVVKLAADDGFFDPKGNATKDCSGVLRTCLRGKGLTNIQDLGKLQTLFNVDETLLTLNPDWFSKMKKTRVLHLGNWRAASNQPIEVLGTKSTNKMKYVHVLDGLENVKCLQLLNLERFSRIRNLPRTISKLTDLTILNIRACHNLEFIPDEIGHLNNLTHLDMSECYLIDRMPKGIGKLKKIQVLKGFVVRDTDSKAMCTLVDLNQCKELRKLSLHIRTYWFPSDVDLQCLQSLKALTKLKIAWGRPLKVDSALSQATSSFEGIDPELPPQLKKLELECLPFAILPSWLRACKLSNLKKLSLRGGNLWWLAEYKDFLGYDDEDVWNVEELHLKYMYNLEMEWSELRKQFPVLKYLEKANCPGLYFFPCDANGVWLG